MVGASLSVWGEAWRNLGLVTVMVACSMYSVRVIWTVKVYPLEGSNLNFFRPVVKRLHR